MHTKSILAISLMAVLVIGVISFEDAFAKKDNGLDTIEVGDELGLKGQGKGACTFGGESGKVKANVRFLLKITEVDEDNIFRGIAKSEIKTTSNCDVIPSGLISDGPLGFAYVPNGVFTIDGSMKDKANNEYTLAGSVKSPRKKMEIISLRWI